MLFKKIVMNRTLYNLSKSKYTITQYANTIVISLTNNRTDSVDWGDYRYDTEITFIDCKIFVDLTTLNDIKFIEEYIIRDGGNIVVYQVSLNDKNIFLGTKTECQKFYNDLYDNISTGGSSGGGGGGGLLGGLL